MIIYTIYLALCIIFKCTGFVIADLKIKAEHPDKDIKFMLWVINRVVEIILLHFMPYLFIRNLFKQI